jgi:mercuric ion transport protein
MMKERAVVGGAVVAGLLASLCCVGPLLFVLLGVSAFGAATAFESARPYLMAGSVLLLAVGYYRTYFRRSETCAPGEACATKPTSRVNRVGLWVASIAVLAFAMTPYFAGSLAARLGDRKAVSEQLQQEDCCVADRPAPATASLAPAAPSSDTTTATLKVTGMTCAGCEVGIRLALEQTPGVRRAEVSYERGEAAVEYDPKTTTPDKLREAIKQAGYSCELPR